MLSLLLCTIGNSTFATYAVSVEFGQNDVVFGKPEQVFSLFPIQPAKELDSSSTFSSRPSDFLAFFACSRMSKLVFARRS